MCSGGCRKAQTQQPCDVRYLGDQVAGNNDNKQQYNVSSTNVRGGKSLGQFTKWLIEIDSKIREDKETVPWHSGYMDQSAPLIVLYIYCAPCVCLIHTAINICAQVSSDAVDVYVRPDNRPTATCCTSVDRTLGLRIVRLIIFIKRV
ncbi:Transcriptional regulatory protein moc3 [Fusarium oxysporum f. sp. albedinis]|nr:Transcriptional regulatory protein moc3 [Fusarium oxysporum f. sp. albedinis]